MSTRLRHFSKFLDSDRQTGPVVYQEPEFLPWDGRQVPLTFVAGYLGAGKTTLINAVLERADRPIAVLVNDVGEINIDARLIARHAGDTIELTDGCVCCSLSDGFGAAFDQLRERETPPDHVIVELTGVAEVARVLPWARSAGFKLDGVVTLVGADQFEAMMGDARVAAAATAQIKAADIVVMTRIDLVDEEAVAALRSSLQAISPSTPIIESADPSAVSELLRLGGRRPRGHADVPEATLFDLHTVERMPMPVPMDRDAIDGLLDSLDSNAVRAKGIAQDTHGDRWLIQVVGARRTVSRLAGVEDAEPTDLVVISLPNP